MVMVMMMMLVMMLHCDERYEVQTYAKVKLDPHDGVYFPDVPTSRLAAVPPQYTVHATPPPTSFQCAFF
jgi:hypothetical protein